ncbi:hypothetical protein SAMD00019534_015520 [Acytostelium subglobosum LB1]|uniref:hypothetical protein n=1 Tax=Acytostelium subglobosum LB1 TaxID=1410327 RepID=UPI000644B45F|nr:hypothetical protein SAMD00019534_015520 [Acytostelium subglobosum LB1]GAM18377.1 hypothetical protein SAMD00019534_015520 [Acytostelium subglobosum LB1]|eukprot:XP_012757597.1 hypothetical protein SAMD00019534_015520 [Acytostelium subglobosum LB1]
MDEVDDVDYIYDEDKIRFNQKVRKRREHNKPTKARQQRQQQHQQHQSLKVVKHGIEFQKLKEEVESLREQNQALESYLGIDKYQQRNSYQLKDVADSLIPPFVRVTTGKNAGVYKCDGWVDDGQHISISLPNGRQYLPVVPSNDIKYLFPTSSNGECSINKIARSTTNAKPLMKDLSRTSGHG